MSRKPVLFDLDTDDTDASTQSNVSDAPPVPEIKGAGIDMGASPVAGDMAAETGHAALASQMSRRRSRLARLFWSLLAALVSAVLALWVWDFLTGLLARVPLLGWAFSAGFAVLLLLAAIYCVRELSALGRMRRVDHLRRSAAEVGGDLTRARAFARDLSSFYAGRADLKWSQQNLADHLPEVMDADAALDLVERELLTPLDQQALAQVEASARQVATVTALVPLALADVVVALVASLRMIRRIGEIYGGRSGGLAAWRLTRRVFSHLVATGAMAVGDDLLEPVLGGSILSKLSRRFGEGLVNGALSARVGLAAIDLCRPMAFSEDRRPKTRQVIQNALKGIVSRSG